MDSKEILSKTYPARTDEIYLRNAVFNAKVGPDAWNRREKSQPVHVSYRAATSITAAAAKDDVSKTLDYGKIYKVIASTVDQKDWDDARQLAQQINVEALKAISLAEHVDLVAPGRIQIDVKCPKAFSSGGWLKYTTTFVPALLTGGSEEVEGVVIGGLHCQTTIGVNPHEKVQKQQVSIELAVENSLEAGHGSDSGKLLQHSLAVIGTLHEKVAGASFGTVEALATFIARLVIMNYGIDQLAISVEKPSAIGAVEAAGVRITRTKAFFKDKTVWDTKGDGETAEQQNC